MPAGEVGEQSAGFGEHDGMVVAACVMTDGLGDERFADADGAVQQDRFAGREKPQRREISDDRGGDRRVVSEVEIFEAGGLLEPGGPDPADDRGGVPAADLVLAEGLEELDVAEVPGTCLSQSGVERVEHPR